MILPSYTADKIYNELLEDHRWIVDNAHSRFKKELKRVRASGMPNKNIEYQISTPNHNQWYVSATLHSRKGRAVTLVGCCAAESEFGVKNYFVLLARQDGRRHFAKITSHTVKRIKERSPAFRNMSAGQICLHIFQRNHGGIYTPNSEKISSNPEETEYDSVFSTKAGVFLGTAFLDRQYSVYLLQTFIHPDMLYTHGQQALYDYHVKSIEFLQHLKVDWRNGEMNITVLTKHYYEKRRIIDWVSGFIDEENSAYETFIIPPML